MEEHISFVLDIVNVIENNRSVIPLFKGLPFLSNPELNLYLEPELISSKKNKENNIESLLYNLDSNELNYIKDNKYKMNIFMNNVLAKIGKDDMKDTIAIATHFSLPFNFVKNYLDKMKDCNLVKLI